MKILLLAPPVYIPTVMPYSLAMMKAVLTSSLKDEIKALDLNALYHYNGFKEFYFRQGKEDFFLLLEKFVNKARSVYPAISKDVLAQKKPGGYDLVMTSILKENPDVVAISLTYNSQVFFTKAIISELQEKGIKVVLGGPADYSKIMENTVVLPDFEKLLEYLVSLGAARKETGPLHLDYSDFQPEHYFTTELIYPLRTSSSCPYQRCAFCTHHGNSPYNCMDLSLIKEAIIRNKMKKVCFIDDDFPIPRLKELAELLAPLQIEWWCQLRPTKKVLEVLPQLWKSGLRSVSWGVESGSQRVLDLIEKGTKIEEVEEVLREGKRLGLKNIVYVLFGFPTETEEEFRQTLSFLEKNSANIDLVSPSVFGLQQGSRAYSEAERFGVKKITFQDRTFLSDKISYEPVSGLSNEEAKLLKKKSLSEINKINKVPRIITACKEQILNM
ncbi:MAG: radical SAM protein [Nanoarchaeota archaeon]|nr:radical SAM protein [Nanoarchaeota archaeon]MBU1644382.1 radical SAM protein [Nanoarchaeota archaeon]MBU1976431.1 radical SAM protein [Nanoarchaeota archaeon]